MDADASVCELEAEARLAIATDEAAARTTLAAAEQRANAPLSKARSVAREVAVAVVVPPVAVAAVVVIVVVWSSPLPSPVVVARRRRRRHCVGGRRRVRRSRRSLVRPAAAARFVFHHPHDRPSVPPRVRRLPPRLASARRAGRVRRYPTLSFSLSPPGARDGAHRRAARCLRVARG